jgi:hypothetical protein
MTETLEGLRQLSSGGRNLTGAQLELVKSAYSALQSTEQLLVDIVEHTRLEYSTEELHDEIARAMQVMPTPRVMAAFEAKWREEEEQEEAE